MLRQRVITAIALGTIALLGMFYLPHPAMTAVLALLVIAGAWEWSALPGFTRYSARLGYVALIAAGLASVWLLERFGANLDLVLYTAIAWWLVALIWIIKFPGAVTSTAAGIAGLFVLIPAWLALVQLHAQSPSLMLFMLLLVVAADIGAYFAGRQFGKHKLAPRVSPGKTWEGVAGGIAGAGVVTLVALFFFDLPVGPFVGLSLFTVLVSVVGDLTESMFKRHAGVKDSGSLLPGHGGVLDRVDSVTAAAPVFLIGLERLGLLR